MFGKWFASTYTGSMLGAGSDVFAVWAWFIATAGPKAHLEINPALLAAMIGEPVERIQAAIDFLLAPDPNSRSSEEEGRRIVHAGAFSYRVVNHEKYRAARSEEARRAQNRDAKRRQRERAKSADSQHASASVSNVSTGQPKTEDRRQKQKTEAEERESPAKPATRAREPEYSAEVIEIAQYLYDAISGHSPDAFSSDPKKVEALLLGWCKAIDLGMRKGTKATKSEKGFNGPNMTLAGAKAVIDLAHRGADDFWHRNMISGSSLRNCYARLVIEARKAYAGARKTNGRPDLSALDDFDFEAAGSLWEAVENEQRRNQARTS